MWINDFVIEVSFGLTRTEQFSIIYGIKLLIFSEWMLFFACFWGIINFRFILNTFSIFFCFPLLSSYSFSIPFSNLIVLSFSSLPIQSSSIFYKVGLIIGCIEQLGQTISCGIVFLVLQIKEFFYSYISISDCIIGSIFYFTTGLHGMHVIIGLLFFNFILIIHLLFIICLFCCYFVFCICFYLVVPIIMNFLYLILFLLIIDILLILYDS
jgi:cytochrome c oxidase subunit 3